MADENMPAEQVTETAADISADKVSTTADDIINSDAFSSKISTAIGEAMAAAMEKHAKPAAATTGLRSLLSSFRSRITFIVRTCAEG